MKKLKSYLLLSILLGGSAISAYPLLLDIDNSLSKSYELRNIDMEQRSLNGVVDPDVVEENDYYNQLVHWNDLTGTGVEVSYFDSYIQDMAETYWMSNGAPAPTKGQAWTPYNIYGSDNGFLYDSETDTYSLTFINFRKIYLDGTHSEYYDYYSDLTEDNAAINDYYVVEYYNGMETVTTGHDDLIYDHSIVAREEVEHEFTGILYNKDNPIATYTDRFGDSWAVGGYVDTISGLEFGKEYYLATDWNNTLNNEDVSLDDENYSKTYSEIFTMNDGVNQGFWPDAETGAIGDSALNPETVHSPKFTPMQYYKNNKIVNGVNLDYDEVNGDLRISFDVLYDKHVDEDGLGDTEWNTYKDLSELVVDHENGIDQVRDEFDFSIKLKYTDEETELSNLVTESLTVNEEEGTISLVFLDDNFDATIDGIHSIDSEADLSNDLILYIDLLNNQIDHEIFDEFEDNSVIINDYDAAGQSFNEVTFVQDYVLEDEAQVSWYFEKEDTSDTIGIHSIELSLIDSSPAGDSIDVSNTGEQTITIEEGDVNSEVLDFNGEKTNHITTSIKGLKPGREYDSLTSKVMTTSGDVYEFESTITTPSIGETVIKPATFLGYTDEGDAQFKFSVSTYNPITSIEFQGLNDLLEWQDMSVELQEVSTAGKSLNREDKEYIVTIKDPGVFLKFRASINGEEYKEFRLEEESGKEVRVLQVIPVANDVPAWMVILTTLLIVIIIIAAALGVFTFVIVKHIDKKIRNQ